MSTLIRLGRGLRGRGSITRVSPHNWNFDFILTARPGSESPSALWAVGHGTLEGALYCTTGFIPPFEVLLTYTGPPLVGGENVTVTFTYDSGIATGNVEAYSMPSNTLVAGPTAFTTGAIALQWTQPAGDSGIEIRNDAGAPESAGCYVIDQTLQLAPPTWNGVPAPPNATVGVPYVYDFSALIDGRVDSASLASGVLPDGLSVVGLTIAGTPTTPT